MFIPGESYVRTAHHLISQLLNLPTSHLLNLSHLGKRLRTKLNNMERKADTFCF